MDPSAAENRFIIDKTAHEALALSSLIEKDCALYHQNRFHLVFDSQKNVVRAHEEFVCIAQLLCNTLEMGQHPSNLLRHNGDIPTFLKNMVVRSNHNASMIRNNNIPLYH